MKGISKKRKRKENKVGMYIVLVNLQLVGGYKQQTNAPSHS